MNCTKSSNRLAEIFETLDDRRLLHPSIRRACIEDLESIAALADVSALGLCAAHYNAAQIKTLMRAGLGVDAQLVQDGTCYVVENRGRIIAVGAWSFRAALMGNMHPDYDGGPRDILHPARNPARLRSFFVDPDFARIGLGRMLVGLCEQAAAHSGFTRVELMATPVARSLFLTCGYEDFEPMTNVFANGVIVPAFRMTKALVQASNVDRSP